jgi:hypothetical protein
MCYPEHKDFVAHRVRSFAGAQDDNDREACTGQVGDSVRFYPLCSNCVSKVETVGGLPPADDVLFLV